MTFEKLPEAQLKELMKLGSDRTGDAAMTVLQLIDDPGQAAAVSIFLAAHLLRLAGLFAHSESIMKDQNKPHSQIVAEMMMELTTAVYIKPPTEKQQKQMRRLKEQFGLSSESTPLE